jgi:hypothetical protein
MSDVGLHSLWFWREKDFKYSNDIFGMKLLAEAFCFSAETVRFVNLTLRCSDGSDAPMLRFSAGPMVGTC